MLLRSSLTLAFAAVIANAASVHYEIQPTGNSRLVLTVEKTGLMSGKKHLFLFERYVGTLSYDAASPERSRVDLSIEAASAVCKDTWVSEKDRNKIQEVALRDMLAAETYPKLLFSSASVTRKGANSFDVQGMLTIRGIAKPATVSVVVHSLDERISSVAGQAIVRLKDYGLKPPSAVLGAIGTKNEMTVEFLLAPGVSPGSAERKPSEVKTP